MLRVLFLLVSGTATNPVGDFNAGLAAEGRNDLASAAVLFDRAQQEMPGWVLPKLELAELLLKEGGAPDRALSLLSAAQLADPSNPRLYHLRALAFAEKGLSPSAEQAERVALSLRGDYPEAEATLADALWAQGKRDEALDHLRHLAAAHPGETARRAQLVDRLIEGGHAVDAERELRQLAAEQPQNPVWHRRLARTLDAEGLVAEANVERERAEKLAGTAPPKRHLRRLPNSRR